jgi:hypothetical protein
LLITTDPPYGQSENGNGGPSTGDGVPRKAGVASLDVASFQSSAYAFANLRKKFSGGWLCALTAGLPAAGAVFGLSSVVCPHAETPTISQTTPAVTDEKTLAGNLHIAQGYGTLHKDAVKIL